MNRPICVEIPVLFFLPVLDLPFELLLNLNFKHFNAEIVIFRRENVNFLWKAMQKNCMFLHQNFIRLIVCYFTLTFSFHTLLEAMTGLTKLTMKKEGSSCTLGLWWVQNKFWLNHRNCFLHHEILKLLFCLDFIKKIIYTFFHLCFWLVLRTVMCSFVM